MSDKQIPKLRDHGLSGANPTKHLLSGTREAITERLIPILRERDTFKLADVLQLLDENPASDPSSPSEFYFAFTPAFVRNHVPLIARECA